MSLHQFYALDYTNTLLQLTTRHQMQETIENLAYTHDSSILRPVSEDALDPEERSCCICFEPFGPTLLTQGGAEVPVQLPCGHNFGKACILSWTLTNNSCPLCRSSLFCIDDRSTVRQFSNSEGPDSADGFSQTEPEDIWLHRSVWDSPEQSHHRGVVSFADIETLIEYYTPDHSNVFHSSQPHQTSIGTIDCAEHRGFCHCGDEENTSNGIVVHERLTSPTTFRTSQVDVEFIDIMEVGSQFADLDYNVSQWMDEYLDEPRVD